MRIAVGVVGIVVGVVLAVTANVVAGVIVGLVGLGLVLPLGRGNGGEYSGDRSLFDGIGGDGGGNGGL